MRQLISTSTRWLKLVALPLLAGACTGGVEAGSPRASNASAGSAAVAPESTDCQADAPFAPARIWRLTDAQFVNAVGQLFGVRMPTEVTEADAGTGDFTNFSELSVATPNAVNAYQTAARQAARQAVASHYQEFMPCAASDACAEQFIRNRVARAFARPLDAAEVATYLGLFRKGLLESPQSGVRMMIEAALQSPSFLYRSELGAPSAGGPTATVTLTPYEVARSLSFSLTNALPDDPLWQKAVDGSLAMPAVLAAEVDRLLELPETRANLSRLAGYWLGIERLPRTEKDLARFPEFTSELKAQMYESARLFVQDILANGTVSDLLTSKRMYLNESLAATFGIPGVTGAELHAMEVTAPERQSGILSQPAVLAAYSRPTRGDPIHRGLFIYYSLVCAGQVPPPPPGALDKAATFPADASERELAGLRAADPVCRACHSRFDPLGLATERFDPIGRYVESDAVGPIDQSAVLAGLGEDLEGPIDGVAALVAKLGAGRRVADCAAGNLAVFTLGRDVKDDTSCALQAVKDRLAETGSFRDFYKALFTSPAFIQRAAL